MQIHMTKQQISQILEFLKLLIAALAGYFGGNAMF